MITTAFFSTPCLQPLPLTARITHPFPALTDSQALFSSPQVSCPSSSALPVSHHKALYSPGFPECSSHWGPVVGVDEQGVHSELSQRWCGHANEHREKWRVDQAGVGESCGGAQIATARTRKPQNSHKEGRAWRDNKGHLPSFSQPWLASVFSQNILGTSSNMQNKVSETKNSKEAREKERHTQGESTYPKTNPFFQRFFFLIALWHK